MLLSAALGGVFVALVGVRSLEGVYGLAVLPLALLALTIFVYFLDRGDSSAPVLILLAAYFLPFRISTGTESPIVDSLALTIAFVGLWIIKKVILRDKKWLYPSPVNLPLLGFVAVTIVSLLWSILFRDPHVYVWDRFFLIQIASTVVMIMLPLALLLVANQIENLKQLRWMAGLTIGVGIAGFLVDRFGLPLPVNTGGLVSMWIVTISISLAIFQRRLPWSIRLGLFALTGWWIYRGFVLNLQWVAGWLPSFVAICVLSFLRSWRVLLVMLVILFLLIGPSQEFYLGTFIQQEAEESLFTRLDAWRVNWEVTKEHLLLGTGPAGYTVYYMTYFPARAMATHSNYVDIIAQTGVLGLGFLCWMFAALTKTGIQLHRRLRRTGNLEESLANAALAGLAGSIVIMMFGDWLFPFAYTQTIAGFDYIVPTWLFLGVILVLDRLTAENPEKPSASPQLANGNLL
jgi:hypothetical protein